MKHFEGDGARGVGGAFLPALFVAGGLLAQQIRNAADHGGDGGMHMRGLNEAASFHLDRDSIAVLLLDPLGGLRALRYDDFFACRDRLDQQVWFRAREPPISVAYATRCVCAGPGPVA